MNNNYGLARFIAALFVIFGHAYTLSGGAVSAFSLYSGRYAVAFFFFGAGYFLTKSLVKKGTTGFAKARIGKIFPELAVCILGTIFVLGPIMTQSTLKEYFMNRRTWLYLLNMLCITVHNLPGVFDKNIYTSTVNGALWTLPVEIICYVGIYIGAKLKVLVPRKILYTVPVFISGIGIVLYIFRGNKVLLNAVVPICMFYFGILYFIYDDIIKKADANAGLVCALAGMCTLQSIGLYYVAVIILYPYSIYTLINNKRQVGKRLGNLGNISYAMYLVGFPVQQMVIAVFGGRMKGIYNIMISVPIVICLAVVVNKVANLLQRELKTLVIKR